MMIITPHISQKKIHKIKKKLEPLLHLEKNWHNKYTILLYYSLKRDSLPNTKVARSSKNHMNYFFTPSGVGKTCNKYSNRPAKGYKRINSKILIMLDHNTILLFHTL